MANSFIEQFASIKNYYSLLGLSANAKNEEIINRTRELLKRYHPDKNPDDVIRATEAAKLINQAKSILLDPQERMKYDRSLINKNAMPVDPNQIRLSGSIRYSTVIKSKAFIQKVLTALEKEMANFFKTPKDVEAKLEKEFKSFNWDQFVRIKVSNVHACSEEDAWNAENVDQHATRMANAVLSGDFFAFSEEFMEIPNSTDLKERICKKLLGELEQAKPTSDMRLRFSRHIGTCFCNLYNSNSVDDVQKWMFKMKSYVWQILRFNVNSDDDSMRPDMNTFLCELRISLLENGFSDLASMLADGQNFDSNTHRLNFFKSCLPNSKPNMESASEKNPLTKLYFAEVHEESDGLTFSGWTVKDSGHVENFLYEESVKKLFENDSIDADEVGDFYLDLVPACKSSSQYLVALITAAKWYLKSMETGDPKKIFLLIKLIEKILKIAQAVSIVLFSSISMRFYLAAQSLGILSKLLEIGKCITSQVIQVYMDWVEKYMHTVRFCCSEWVPNISVMEADMYQMLASKLTKDYLMLQKAVLGPESRCKDEQGGSHKEKAYGNLTIDEIYEASECDNSMTVFTHELSYYHFEQALCESEMDDLSGTRTNCIDAFLDEVEMQWQQIAACLQGSVVKSSPGWNKLTSPLSPEITQDQIRHIHGIRINTETGDFSLLLEAAPKQKSLICSEDIAVAISMGGMSYFSLDPAFDVYASPLHPMQKMRYGPNMLSGSKFLNTLFLADYWMKFMSTGHEINCQPPFDIREITEGEFWKGVPDNIRVELSKLYKEKQPGIKMSRFWIQADSIEVQQHSVGNGWVEIRFGEVKMSIRTHPLIPNDKGELVDTEEDVEKDSPESKFAESFTKFYDELAKHSPIFARLKELARVQHAGLYIGSIKHQISNELREVNESPEKVYDRKINEMSDQLHQDFELIVNGTSLLIDDGIDMFASSLKCLTYDERKTIVKQYFYSSCDTLVDQILVRTINQRDPIYVSAMTQMEKALNEVKAQLAAYAFDRNDILKQLRGAGITEPSDSEILSWLNGYMSTNALATVIVKKRVQDDIRTGVHNIKDAFVSQLAEALHITLDEVEGLLNKQMLPKDVSIRAAKSMLGPQHDFVSKSIENLMAAIRQLDTVIIRLKEAASKLNDGTSADHVPAVISKATEAGSFRISFGGVVLCPVETRVTTLSPISQGQSVCNMNASTLMANSNAAASRGASSAPPGGSSSSGNGGDGGDGGDWKGWKNLDPCRSQEYRRMGFRTNGLDGNDRLYYKQDRFHKDAETGAAKELEVYKYSGGKLVWQHSIDANTGETIHKANPSKYQPIKVNGRG